MKPRLPRVILGAPYGSEFELLDFCGRVAEETKLAASWAKGVPVDDSERTEDLLHRFWSNAWRKAEKVNGATSVMSFDRALMKELFVWAGRQFDAPKQITTGDAESHHG